MRLVFCCSDGRIFVLVDFISRHFLHISVSVSDFVVTVTCIVAGYFSFMVDIVEASSDDSTVVMEYVAVVVYVVVVVATFALF